MDSRVQCSPWVVLFMTPILDYNNEVIFDLHSAAKIKWFLLCYSYTTVTKGCIGEVYEDWCADQQQLLCKKWIAALPTVSYYHLPPGVSSFFRQIYFFFLATVPTVSYYHLHSIASSRIFLPFFHGYFSSGAIKGFFLHQLHHKHSVAEIGVLLMGTFPEGQLKCFSFLMAIFSKISCFLSANDPNCNLFVLDLFNLSILTFG